MTIRTTATLLCLSLLTAGCNLATEPDVCTAAAGHLQSCFGSIKNNPYALPTCNQDSAARVLSRDCKTLSYAMMGGKADDLGLDEQIQQAIKDAIRQGIVAGLKQVIEQVLGGLSGSILKKYDFYLMLHLADSKSAAKAKAEELRPLLASDPDMDPMVIKIESGYAVIHGPCPVKLSSHLAGKIADIVAGNPKLVEALGGTITHETPDPFANDPEGEDPEGEDPEVDEGDEGGEGDEGDEGDVKEKTYKSNMKISLPLAFLPLPRSYSKKLGCDKY